MSSRRGKRSRGGVAPADESRLVVRPTELAVLTAVVVAGLLLRWMYFREIHVTPEFTHPLVDPLFNDYWARGIATGDWSSDLVMRAYGFLPDIRNLPCFRAPGYAYFLATIYRVFGSGYAAVRVVQMGLGLASTLLGFRLGRDIFGRPVGLVFAGLMSVYWGFIFFEGELGEVSILTLLLLLLVYFLHRSARFGVMPNALFAGLVCGVAALMRPNVLLLSVAAIAWGWWVVRRRRGIAWFRGFTGLLLLAAAVTISPATIRNYAVSGEFVPLSTNLGVNLYIGNNASADGTFTNDAPELSGYSSCFDYPRTVAGLESELGSRLTYPQASAHLASKAVGFATRNPGRVLKLLLRKAYLLVSPHEIALNRVVHFERMNSRTLSSIPLNFPVVLSIGVVGVVLSVRSRRRRGAESSRRSDDGESGPGLRSDAEEAASEASLLPPILGAAYFASLLPFFVAAAYRMPMVPFLLLPGAYAVCWIAARVRARDLRPAAVWSAVLVALFVVASVPFITYEPDLGKWHVERAVVRDLDGRYGEAAAEYRKALEAEPGAAPAHYNLAIVLARTGQLEDAADHLERAVELDPDMSAAHSALANVRIDQGRRAEAVSSLRRVLELRPRSTRERALLVRILMEDGAAHEAVSLMEEALRVNPDDAVSMTSLSWVLATSADAAIRDGERAIILARRAAEISGGYAHPVLRAMAAAHAEVGEFETAVEIAERALELAAQARRNTAVDEEALRLYRAGRPYRAE